MEVFQNNKIIGEWIGLADFDNFLVLTDKGVLKIKIESCIIKCDNGRRHHDS